MWQNGQGRKGNLVIENTLEAIQIKAHIFGHIRVMLWRDGEGYGSFYLFGAFDGSHNQTDCVIYPNHYFS